MIGFKTNFLLICLLVNNMAQQWYRMRTTYPDFLAICTEQKVGGFYHARHLDEKQTMLPFSLRRIKTTVDGIVRSFLGLVCPMEIMSGVNTVGFY